jgi:hypothetical protein
MIFWIRLVISDKEDENRSARKTMRILPRPRIPFFREIDRRGFFQAGAALIAIRSAPLLYAAATNPQQIETPHGSLGLKDLALSPEDLTIHGTVTNHTDRAWRWATFLLRMRDPAGRTIPHDDRFDGYFYVQNLGRNESKVICDRLGRPARLLLRPTRQPVSVQAQFIAERSYFDSHYVFAMISPKAAADLAYEDEWLRVELKPAVRLHLHLVNRARQRATIDWEKIVFVDLGGTRHRVIHGETKLTEKDKPQAPRTVDAETTLQTTLYPADQVMGSRIFEDWRLNPLLPLSQYAPLYKWRTFSLLMPWSVGGQTRQYQFTVRIQDVLV